MRPNKTDELRSLVKDCDAFSQCEECGKHVVNLAGHRCGSSTSGSPSTRSMREALADGDTRSDDDAVGIYRRTLGDTYAYHELDGDDIHCGCGEYTKADELEVITRGEAKALGRSPCGTCKRLRSIHDGE
jgi:hypothetical protein